MEVTNPWEIWQSISLQYVRVGKTIEYACTEAGVFPRA